MAEQITTAEFESRVLGATEPVLVDFFATWCGPCKMMTPVLDELSQDVAGKASVYKVDIDQDMELAQRYGIMSVPTFMVFKGGSAAAQFVGVTPKAVLADALA